MKSRTSTLSGLIQGTKNELSVSIRDEVDTPSEVLFQEEETLPLFPTTAYKSRFTQFFRGDGSKFVPSSDGFFHPRTDEEIKMMAYYASKGLAFEETK